MAFLTEAETAARRVRWFLRAAMAVAAAYMLAITWPAPDLAPGWLRHVANGLHGLLPAWFAVGDAPAATLARQHVGAAGIIGLIAIPMATAGYAMTRSGELAKGCAMADDLLPYPFLRLPGRLMAAFAVAGLGWVQGLEVLWWLVGIVGWSGGGTAYPVANGRRRSPAACRPPVPARRAQPGLRGRGGHRGAARGLVGLGPLGFPPPARAAADRS